MKEIIRWMMALVMVVGVGLIKVQAEEEGTVVEPEELVLEEVGEEAKTLKEMWQPVKEALEKVKARESKIADEKKKLAKVNDPTAVENYKSAIQREHDILTEEIKNLYTAIVEFGKWVEEQELEEEELEKGFQGEELEKE